MYFRKFASHLLWEIREKRREWYQFDGIWDEEGWYIKVCSHRIYDGNIFVKRVMIEQISEWMPARSHCENICRFSKFLQSARQKLSSRCNRELLPPSYNSNFVRVSRLRRWYKVNFEFSSSFFDRKSIIFSGEYKYLETFRINFRENFSKFVKFLHKFQF